MLWMFACTPAESPESVTEPSDEPDGALPGDTADEPKARWNYLVFMNGDNDLESYVTHDLDELEEVGSVDGVNVLVQADRIEGYDDDDGDWTGTRRYFITADGVKGEVGSEVLADMGELDMGDPSVLSDFLMWAAASYPAEHTALILWDHGDGWYATLDGDANPPPAISWDDTDGGDLSIAEGDLRDALEPFVSTHGPLDVIGFDACNMSGFEVGHSLREQALFMSAAETTVGWEGFQYGDAVALLAENAAADGRELAAEMSRGAVEDGGEYTHAALDLAKMDQLATAVDALAGLALEDPDTFEWARDRAKSADRMWHDYYLDLADLAQVLAGGDDQAMASAAADVGEALDEAFVASYRSDDYEFLGGLWIYGSEDEEYIDAYAYGDGATWARATRWDDLLLSFAEK
jgi:hypothetical protein